MYPGMQTIEEVLAELGFSPEGVSQRQVPDTTLILDVVTRSLNVYIHNSKDNVRILGSIALRVELCGPEMPGFYDGLNERLGVDLANCGKFYVAKFSEPRGSGFEAALGMSLKEMAAEYDGKITQLPTTQ